MLNLSGRKGSEVVTLEYIHNVDDGGSWRKLMDEVEAETDDKSQQEEILTERVLERFINRLYKDSAEKKQGIKRSFETTTSSEEQEAEDYSITKQKTGTQKEEEKQKTGSEKKQDRMKRMDRLEPPPDMPQEFKNKIEELGGTDVKLVTQKFIERSDLNPQHNRFSMTEKQVRNEFLSEAEQNRLDTEEKPKKKKGMDVKLVQPCLEVTTVCLSKWSIGRSRAYVFKTEWNQIVKNPANALKAEEIVQVWSFRVQPEWKLGFAMIKVKEGEMD